METALILINLLWQWRRESSAFLMLLDLSAASLLYPSRSAARFGTGKMFCSGSPPFFVAGFTQC